MNVLKRLFGRRNSLGAATERLTQVALEQQQLKQRHPALFAEMSAAFFEVDPVGINFDDNTDEYDAEVGTVLPRLDEAQSAADVNRILREEFGTWFGGVSVDRQRLARLGDRVWDIWTRRVVDGQSPVSGASLSLSMTETPEQPPEGWRFAVEEVANSGWRCVGKRSSGHTVSREGPDPDGVRRDCWAAARWVDAQLETVAEARH